MDCETRQVFDTGDSTIEQGPSQAPGAVFFWSAVLAVSIVMNPALAVIKTVEAVYVHVFGKGAWRANIFVVAPILDAPASTIQFLT